VDGFDAGMIFLPEDADDNPVIPAATAINKHTIAVFS
jgi:hypothetical protein